jgi:CBS domain-containing protein
MRVEEIMTRRPVVCRPNETMERAAYLMWECDCGSIPVVDEQGRPVGMITDRDICMAAYTQGRTLKEMKVHSAMAKRVFAIDLAAEIEQAERLMQTQRVRRLPVVNSEGALVGVLSLNDIARHATRLGLRGKISEHEVTETLAAICQSHSIPQQSRPSAFRAV